MSKSGRTAPQRNKPSTARPGLESFARIEAKAREVLRERGFTDEMIEAELKRVRRHDPGN
jgi:hypothetical protein